jgi:hypothetical protein
LELVSGVAQLRPEDAMVEAMLRGWRAQQAARGLKDGDTIGPRERMVRRFLAFTNEYPWAWSPGHVDEWSLQMTTEQHLAPSTIRGYQCSLRLFTEFLADGRSHPPGSEMVTASLGLRQSVTTRPPGRPASA